MNKTSLQEIASAESARLRDSLRNSPGLSELSRRRQRAVFEICDRLLADTMTECVAAEHRIRDLERVATRRREDADAMMRAAKRQASELRQLARHERDVAVSTKSSADSEAEAVLTSALVLADSITVSAESAFDELETLAQSQTGSLAREAEAEIEAVRAQVRSNRYAERFGLDADRAAA